MGRKPARSLGSESPLASQPNVYFGLLVQRGERKAELEQDEHETFH